MRLLDYEHFHLGLGNTCSPKPCESLGSFWMMLCPAQVVSSHVALISTQLSTLRRHIRSIENSVYSALSLWFLGFPASSPKIKETARINLGPNPCTGTAWELSPDRIAASRGSPPLFPISWRSFFFLNWYFLLTHWFLITSFHSRFPSQDHVITLANVNAKVCLPLYQVGISAEKRPLVLLRLSSKVAI